MRREGCLVVHRRRSRLFSYRRSRITPRARVTTRFDRKSPTSRRRNRPLTLHRTVSTTIQTNRCASSIRLNETHMTKWWPVMRPHGPRRESRQRFRRFAGAEPLRMLDTDSLGSVADKPLSPCFLFLEMPSTEICVRDVAAAKSASLVDALEEVVQVKRALN